ncbi:M14 family zinc carboxypeptidase [Desulfuribacillus alkaliarsenatis]|uniref:Peptidase M14 domain-containing protein n=1 Tax=Desulfuribacillus alkaliarsenatis TaxID=766136 RepID=A0A1E5G5E2_9FIRM|nr:M14 family zinc carboxypeptidase [Desulfuribacillus alkaliarsenatis]OEF98388.1 hypothetical protein BHF68_01540 [Desulfuribacillus alkaliarsenatis]
MAKYKCLIFAGFLFLLLATKSSASTTPIEIVTIKNYDYVTLKQDLHDLKHTHSDIIDYWVLGQSFYNRDIFVVTLGSGDAVVYIDGSRHGREWISTYITMKMIEEYAHAITFGDGIYGEYNVQDILNKVTFYFIPMINPDGVDLTIHGLTAFPEESHEALIGMNDGSTDFQRWKANALGIDLNRIWDAGWDEIINSPPGPSWHNFKGVEPFDQRAVEDLYIRDFVYEIDPEIAVSYHSTGRILYWWWRELDPSLEDMNFQIASRVSQLTDYPLFPANRPHTNGGGMTDWFTKEFQRPGLTPELAPFHYHQPVELQWFAEEWDRNKYVGLSVAEEAYKLWWERNDMKNHWAYEAYMNLYNENIITEEYLDLTRTIKFPEFLELLHAASISSNVEIEKQSFHRLDLARIANDIINPNIPTINYVTNYAHYTAMFRNLKTVYFPHKMVHTVAVNKLRFNNVNQDFLPYMPVSMAEVIDLLNKIITDDDLL